MGKGLLDPKVDFVFKNIFGSPKHPKVLISFLNAVLKPTNKITSVELKGTEIGKQFIEDKYSRLDVRATTSNEEIINIEIQLKNEYNMIKRSLYYLSKMYEEQLGDGEDYSKTDFDCPCALVIGNEGRGIGQLVEKKCDAIVSLPMLGKINSLNASVAAGILMYAVVKSRKGI